MGHVEVDPDTNDDKASWWCVDDEQTCASHNPCDCCDDAAREADHD